MGNAASAFPGFDNFLICLAYDQWPEGKGREIALTLPQAPWPLPRVPGDHDLLFLAIHNVLDNALKFTRPGDTIEVRAVEDAPVVTVEIADTGPGIPEDELPHVFEELYRGQGARGIEGSGLGLALVRAIVERHGGTVSVRSREGESTVFTLHPLSLLQDMMQIGARCGRIRVWITTTSKGAYRELSTVVQQINNRVV